MPDFFLSDYSKQGRSKSVTTSGHVAKTTFKWHFWWWPEVGAWSRNILSDMKKMHNEVCPGVNETMNYNKHLYPGFKRQQMDYMRQVVSVFAEENSSYIFYLPRRRQNCRWPGECNQLQNIVLQVSWSWQLAF